MDERQTSVQKSKKLSIIGWMKDKRQLKNQETVLHQNMDRQHSANHEKLPFQEHPNF
jgi:hypothetical protein